MSAEAYLAEATAALQRGDHAAAMEAARRAVIADPTSLEALHLLGNAHLSAGDAANARAAYLRVLALEPTFQKTLANLGRLHLGQGETAEAMTWLERAVLHHPDAFRARTMLADTCVAIGRPAEAEAHYAAAVNVAPTHVPALLGLARLRLATNPPEALSLFERSLQLERTPQALSGRVRALAAGRRVADAGAALAAIPAGALPAAEYRSLQAALLALIQPTTPDLAALVDCATDVEILIACALVLTGREDVELAGLALRRAVQSTEALPRQLVRAGDLLVRLQRNEEAADCYTRVLASEPDSLDANLGMAQHLASNGRRSEALAHVERALRATPGSIRARFALATLMATERRYTEAEHILRDLCIEAPDSAVFRQQYGSTLSALGKVEAAVAQTRIAIELAPNQAHVRSNLLWQRMYRAFGGPWELAEHHVANAVGLGLWSKPAAPIARRGLPERLRIGYLSPDFRRHSVANFLLPLLRAHDRTRFEIFGYYSLAIEDSITARIRELCDGWRPVAGWSDARIADRVRADEIDVLIELAGHTGDTRASVLCLRAAPLQITYLGYPATTGFPEVDYRIANEYCDPVGVTDGMYSERLLRIPNSAWCFEPFEDARVSEPPSVARGYVTFGSVNTVAKITPTYLSVCSAILQRVPGSRLLFTLNTSADPVQAEVFRTRLAAHGIPPDRVDFADWKPNALHAFDEIDIVLDTFPFNGHTMSCFAMWAGVPIITLEGDSNVSRVGGELLRQTGLSDLLATSPALYVENAVRLANDPARLRDLRFALRSRMQGCSLSDPRRFAGDFERAIETAWRGPLKVTDDAQPPLRPAPAGTRVVALSARARVPVSEHDASIANRHYVLGAEGDAARRVVHALAGRLPIGVIELNDRAPFDGFCAAADDCDTVVVARDESSLVRCRAGAERGGLAVSVRRPEGLADGLRTAPLSVLVVYLSDDSREPPRLPLDVPAIVIGQGPESEPADTGRWITLRPAVGLDAFVEGQPMQRQRGAWCLERHVDALVALGCLVRPAAVPVEPLPPTGNNLAAAPSDVVGQLFDGHPDEEGDRLARLWLSTLELDDRSVRLATWHRVRDRLLSRGDSLDPAGLTLLCRVLADLGDPRAPDTFARAIARLNGLTEVAGGVLAVREESVAWGASTRNRLLASLILGCERMDGFESEAARLEALHRFATLGVPSERMSRALEIAVYEASRPIRAAGA